jgi:hypothetical protein
MKSHVHGNIFAVLSDGMIVPSIASCTCCIAVAELASIGWKLATSTSPESTKEALDSGNREDLLAGHLQRLRYKTWESNWACPATFHEIRSHLFNDQ